MGRPALEVADIFRAHASAWREARRARLSLAQIKVMSAIIQCRTAALGGHVLRCDGCGVEQVSYNSCLMESGPIRGVRGIRRRRLASDSRVRMPRAAHHYFGPPGYGHRAIYGSTQPRRSRCWTATSVPPRRFFACVPA